MTVKPAFAAVAALALGACAANHAIAPLPSGSGAARVRDAASETVVYSFRAGNDGADPFGTLIADRSGALYGTTAFGGGGSCFAGCGTVFTLTPSGSAYSEAILYSFRGSSANDGSGPAAGLVADASGALYGTTEYGGDTAGNGTVFKLTPNGSSYSETVLHRFSGGKDGTAPLGALTLDARGNLYGTTLLGGSASACGPNGTGGYEGCGTVFELARSGSTYKERVLYRFQSGTDGATPGSPPVIIGKLLVGTAATGGGNPSCGGAPINRGCGTVYALTIGRKHATLTVLYAFTGEPSDGANPFAGLAINKSGVLYGSTQYGGSANEGAAFSLTPSGSHYTEKVLHSFTGGSDGAYPLAPLALGKHGRLYGVTQYGGSSNAGVAFELRKARGAYVESVLYTFATAAGGEYPVGGLLERAGGTLYGTTTYGGAASSAAGTVFTLSP